MFVLPLARTTSYCAAAVRSHLVRSHRRSPVRRIVRPLRRRRAGSGRPARPRWTCPRATPLTRSAFDVPGATRDALKVSVEGRRVTLTTVARRRRRADRQGRRRRPPRPSPRSAPLYRERATPVYARTVALPAEVDQQASQAKFENGVLTLVLAKKVADRRDPAADRLRAARARPPSRAPQAAASGQRGSTSKAWPFDVAAMPRCHRIAAASAIIAPLSVQSASSGK